MNYRHSNSLHQDRSSFLLRGRTSAEVMDVDDDGLSDLDAAKAALRTTLITALAGALTAVTVLVGWGLQINAGEIERRRAESLARESPIQAVVEIDYFQSGRSAVSRGEFRVDLQADFSGDLSISETTNRRLAEIQAVTTRASDYARKRDRLAGLLGRLAELSGRELESSGVGEMGGVGEARERAEYRVLLGEADALRGELSALLVAEEPLLRGTLSKAEAPLSGALNLAKVSALDSAAMVSKSERSGLEDLGSAEAHCRKLLADLESSRLSTIADLAFVEDTGEFPF